jgi:hypothetical protein
VTLAPHCRAVYRDVPEMRQPPTEFLSRLRGFGVV